MKSIEVEVQQDIVEKLSRSQPIFAISELIWNAFDADANIVNVFVENNSLGAQSEIIIEDDGIGIPYDKVEELFKKLGDSWKKYKLKTKKFNRDLHGKEGRGRFKAFALGRIATWEVVYEKKAGEFWEYKIDILRDDIKKVNFSDEVVSKKSKSGVKVTISELHKNFRSLEDDKAEQNICENFAIYLKNYSQIVLAYNGKRINPDDFIREKKLISLDELHTDNGIFNNSIEIIEWNISSERKLYLCNSKGFPYNRLEEIRFHVGSYNFSAYLKSEYVEDLYQKNLLDIGGMDEHLNQIVNQAKGEIKKHFLEKSAKEARNIVQEWKSEKIYPYDTETSNVVEEVERKVFDIVALNVNENLPDFSEATNPNKKLSLRLLRQAIEKGPDELQIILSEVLNLPHKKQKELASLLQDTTLSAIINASKLISDRLNFIEGLEEIVFDPELKKYLKERSQLHKILAENTWLFGEEFNLSVNDQSLTAVLRKHKNKLGEDVIIDKPVKRIDGKKGIVDLMLSRQIKLHRKDEFEHLVIELKAPKVILSSKEATQIQDYAFAVAKDERFKNLHTRWNFWLVSDEYDEHVERLIKQRDREEGILYISDRMDNPNVTIWVKTWSQIIRENKTRLHFIKEKLEYQTDKAKSLDTLRKKYSSIIENTELEDALKWQLLCF